MTKEYAHKNGLLYRAEIRHSCPFLNVLKDVIFFEELVRAVSCDIFISHAVKELLGRGCQDYREDVFRVFFVGNTVVRNKKNVRYKIKSVNKNLL